MMMPNLDSKPRNRLIRAAISLIQPCLVRLKNNTACCSLPRGVAGGTPVAALEQKRIYHTQLLLAT